MSNDNIFTVNGEEVVVKRKNIKNMYLRIKDPEGPLELSIPRRMGVGEALDFVRKKESWIRRKRQQLRESEFRADADRQPEYVSGEKLRVWGKELTLQVLEGEKAGIRLDDSRIFLSVPEGTTREQRRAVFDAFLAGEMQRYLKSRVPVIEAATGLHCDKWRIRSMKSRWGSCSLRTGIITINLNLATMEKIYTDYVITHELAHTRVPNHGPAFYALMDECMPEWRSIRKAMR